jgi:DNA polymerase
MTLPFVPYTPPSLPFCGLVILGEAPGVAEVEQGKGFVGRSGKLLDQALAAVGIDRRACLVANVFRYRPPDNKVRHFFQSERQAGKDGTALARQFGRSGLGFCRADYAPELEHLAETLREARAVLALGAVPLWATTGRAGVIENAGQVLACSLAELPGVSVFPTYHPAFLIRGKHHLLPTWQSHIAKAK